MGQQVPKVGDIIKIVSAYLTDGKYGNGAVFTVATVKERTGSVWVEEGGLFIMRQEFIILDNPTTQPETYFVTIDGISTEVREVKREAKTGERVKIVNWKSYSHDSSLNGAVNNGQIYQVKDDRFGFVDISVPQSRLGWAALTKDEYVVLEPTGVVSVDGTKYGKVTNLFPKRGDLVLVKANSRGNKAGDHHWPVPSIAEYDCLSYHRDHVCLTQGGWRHQTLLRADIEFVVKVDEPAAPKTSSVESAPMPNATDAKRAELQSKIDALTSELAKLPTTTAAEQQAKREAAIAFAKQFVADIQDMGDKQNGNRKNLSLLVGSKYHDYYYRVSFETVGRTVKATVQTYTYFGTENTYFSPSVGTCAFSDGIVFNEHIAKAQALVSALGIKMPSELTNIPEPTVAKSGNTVRGKNTGATYTLANRRPDRDDFGCGTAFNIVGKTTWVGTDQFDIVDDTNP